MPSVPENDISHGRQSWLKRWLPLAVLAAGLIAFFVLDLGQYLSFQALGQRRTELLAWVADWPFAAPLVFMAAYAAVVALSLPIAVVFSLAAGFLFGAILGTIYAVVAATIGATLVFLAVRSALGEKWGENWSDRVARRAGPAFRQLEAGFKANELNYLLFLRLVPVFPFWLVNLAAAFVGVRLRTFVVGTVIGIIPGGFVYVNVGRGLGTIFDAGEEPSLENILSFDLLIAFSLLGLLALAPIAYRKFRVRANSNAAK